MNRIIIFSLIICAISLASCKKNTPGSASFTSEFAYTSEIPTTAVTSDTTINVSSEISITDARLENCEKASLKSFYVQIDAPAGKTFDFCKEAHLWLSAPGIPEIDVISVSNISSTATRIDFTVNSTELVQFLKKPSMTAKLKVVLTKSCSTPTKISGKMVFNVQGKL